MVSIDLWEVRSGCKDLWGLKPLSAEPRIADIALGGQAESHPESTVGIEHYTGSTAQRV